MSAVNVILDVRLLLLRRFGGLAGTSLKAALNAQHSNRQSKSRGATSCPLHITQEGFILSNFVETFCGIPP